MARDTGRSGGWGLGLVFLSLVGLFVAWPPPPLRMPVLLGFAPVFIAAPVAFVAQLVAIPGGVILGRRLSRGLSTGRRLVIGAGTPIVVVALEGAYLVHVIGFDLQAPAVAGPLAFAAIIGLAAEIPR